VRNHPERDVEERYKLLEPYLGRVRNSAYFRSLERAADMVHGIKSIDGNTIAEFNEKFKAAASDENYRNHVMKGICNIDVSLNDGWLDDMNEAKTELFAPVWRPDGYAHGHVRPEQPTLEEYLENYRKNFTRNVEGGLAALKIGLAYDRPIYFEDVDYKTAAGIYKKYRDDEDTAEFPTPLQDHIIHYALKCAEEAGITVQIHTGLQEGMENNLKNSDPMLLRNLFRKFTDLTFDVFHMGYPYERELITQVKTHANVNIDMCWANLISPGASRAAFAEMLDVIPYTKICAFGGDYLFYDGVAGHVSIAKENICTVLADKITSREMKEDFALRILQAVFRENPIRIFRLNR